MAAGPIVREFRHILLWPLQLRRMPLGTGFKHPWEALQANPGPWTFVKDNLLVDDETCAKGYREFVYFLPYVQRFLYGFGEADAKTPSSLTVFRRDDIARVKIHLRHDCPGHVFDVARVRLMFFYDMDIAIFAIELVAQDIALADAVETMDRFGRPYPPSWGSHGQAAHCTWQVEFLDREGHLISASDYSDREKYIELVRDVKQTPLSMHWEQLLKPMVPAYLGGGPLQYYQIENKRIPIMTYLAFDDPHSLTLGDFARIGYATKWGPSETLPFSARFLADFEKVHCYDRYWDKSDPADELNTRYLVCGPALCVVTRQGDAPDLLEIFRHQLYRLGIIVNFHKGALLNLSNRFSISVERLRVGDHDSVRVFKQTVRETLELFLRFNHRYWFHEISNQVLAADLYRAWSKELGSQELYDDVREEARDINEYLDADRTRRSADNAQRLTVVSACGMVGMVATGFLGMNLFNYAEMTPWWKFAIFMIVFIPSTLLTVYTVIISRRLGTFFEALASERMTWSEKMGALRQIWGSGKRARMKRVAGGDAPTRRTSRVRPAEQHAPPAASHSD